MFELPTKVLNRGGFQFRAELVNGKFVYETADKDEITVLKGLDFVKEVKAK